MTSSLEPRDEAPETPAWTTWSVGLALGILAVAAAGALVLGRGPELSGRWFGMSPDARQYLAAVQDGPVAAPFRHRVLVPWLASLLPVDAPHALKTLNLAAYALAFTVLFALLRRCGVSLGSALLALLGAWGTVRLMILVQNPYLVDTASLLAQSTLLYACVDERPRTFCASCTLGVLAREDVLFTAPSWLLARRDLWGAAALAAAGTAYVAPRALWPGLQVDWQGWGTLFSLSTWLKLYFAFGWLWTLAAFGLFGLRGSGPRENLLRRPVWAFAALGLGGSLISILAAEDVIRVTLPLVPALVLGLGLTVDRMRARPALRGLYVAACCLGPWLAIPNVALGALPDLASLDDWYRDWRLPIVAHQLLGLGVAAALLFGGRRGGHSPAR